MPSRASSCTPSNRVRRHAHGAANSCSSPISCPVRCVNAIGLCRAPQISLRVGGCATPAPRQRTSGCAELRTRKGFVDSSAELGSESADRALASRFHAVRRRLGPELAHQVLNPRGSTAIRENRPRAGYLVRYRFAGISTEAGRHRASLKIVVSWVRFPPSPFVEVLHTASCPQPWFFSARRQTAPLARCADLRTWGGDRPHLGA